MIDTRINLMGKESALYNLFDDTYLHEGSKEETARTYN